MHSLALLDLEDERMTPGEYEARRQQNIREKNEMLRKLFGDIWTFQTDTKPQHSQPTKRRSKKKKTPKPQQPVRRSPRLRSDKSKQDLTDYFSDPEELFKPKTWSDDDDDIFLVPPPPTSRSSRASVPNLPVVDDRYLSKIATSSFKEYDPVNGTTCHQCRQKTKDSKTICRGPDCRGVRGFFCGPCLRNRYGEDVREALLDENWRCPPCRGLCNCSICFRRAGLPCTGILAPSVQTLGFNSVNDYILSKSKKNREKLEAKKLFKEIEKELKKVQAFPRDDKGQISVDLMMEIFEETEDSEEEQ